MLSVPTCYFTAAIVEPKYRLLQLACGQCQLAAVVIRHTIAPTHSVQRSICTGKVGAVARDGRGGVEAMCTVGALGTLCVGEERRGGRREGKRGEWREGREEQERGKKEEGGREEERGREKEGGREDGEKERGREKEGGRDVRWGERREC